MISEALKHLRQREDITQAELANDFGITQQAVARWEQDKSDPDVATLKKLAKYFNVSADYLLGYGETINQYPLSEEQLSLIEDYDSLGTDGRNLLKGVLASLCLTHSRKKTNYVTTI